MDDFESVYLQDEFNSNEKRLCALDRLKIGEIFQVRHNQFVFVCIHCSQEFQQFARFTAHIQNHYHNALQWIAPEVENQNVPSEMLPTPSMNMENVEWLFSDSSENESTCGDDDDDDNQPVDDVDCKDGIRDDDSESVHDTSLENDDTNSLESRFKLRHPLIRVKDTSDTRKLMPYFSKKFSFKRTQDHRFKCPICDYLALSKANIREHIFTHAEMKMFACKLCNKDFTRPRNTAIHIEQKHSDVAVLTPDRPPKKLKIEKIDGIGNSQSTNIIISPKVKLNTKMMYSMSVNGDKTRSQCFICMKTFSRPNGIVKHMKTHTQVNDCKIMTKQCQFVND